MYSKYTLLALLATLGACAGAAPGPAPMAEPTAAIAPAADVAPAPAVQISLEQRWAAPFAVETLGDLAPREERVVVVVDPAAPAAPKTTRVARAESPQSEAAPRSGGGTAAGTAAPAESAP